MRNFIDINVDLGEGFNNECFIMPFISSCNVACGGHAGDFETMKKTLFLAKSHNVRVGAHPGFPDKGNFGRQVMNLSFGQLTESIFEQINSLQNIGQEIGVEIEYIKPHGALYHKVCSDVSYSNWFLKFIKENFPNLKIMGLPNCLLQELCSANNLSYIKEGFADRVYEDDGNLRSRNLPASNHEESVLIIEQIVDLINGKVNTYGGETICFQVDSICFHGDHPGSADRISFVVNKLLSEGYEIRN